MGKKHDTKQATEIKAMFGPLHDVKPAEKVLELLYNRLHSVYVA